jgi:hypothetical protein
MESGQPDSRFSLSFVFEQGRGKRRGIPLRFNLPVVAVFNPIIFVFLLSPLWPCIFYPFSSSRARILLPSAETLCELQHSL